MTIAKGPGDDMRALGRVGQRVSCRSCDCARAIVRRRRHSRRSRTFSGHIRQNRHCRRRRIFDDHILRSG